ncbi:MAG: GtrA family protein [Solirubrobacteraceae bacterium]
MTPDRRQGLLYLAVGGWNTVFAFAMFAGLRIALGDAVHYLAVLAIAWVIGVLESFVAYRLIVFRVHGHVLRDLARFSSVYVGAFLFNLAALPLAVDVIGIQVLVAQAAVVLVTVVSSFVLHRRFSFRREVPEPVRD